MINKLILDLFLYWLHEGSLDTLDCLSVLSLSPFDGDVYPLPQPFDQDSKSSDNQAATFLGITAERRLYSDLSRLGQRAPRTIQIFTSSSANM